MPPKDRNKYKLRKKENETCVRLPGEIDGKDFAIMKCMNCDIYLYDYFEQVFIDDSENCRIFVGPTRGSIFVRDCKNIKLYSASQQLRISDSSDIVACVYSGSDPALENVTGLKMAPFNFIFPDVANYFKKADLNPNEDYWSQVFDFTSKKTVDNKPNWVLLDPKDYEGPIIKELEGIEGDMTNPVEIPQEYGGTSTKAIIVGSQDPGSQQDTAGMMSFSIQTSQQQAQEQVEQVEEQQQENNNMENQNQNNNDNDDFFQQQDQQQQQQEEIQQQPQTNNYDAYDEWSNQEQQVQQQPQQMFAQQNNQYQSELTEEQQQRQSNKQKQEEIIRQRVIKIQEQEKTQKAQRQQEAREWLNNWQTQREQNKAKQAQFLRENNQIEKENRKKENEGNTLWKKVTSNIPLKQSDYPGSKDVTCMKNAILNKKKDEETNKFKN